jgi:hypothetical protein
MTAINIATDIPSTINTVEQLSAWCSNVLSTLNSNVSSVEGDNYSLRSAQSGNFYIASVDKTRHVGRQSLELAPDYQVGGAKPWSYVMELSQKPLTTAMKSN